MREPRPALKKPFRIWRGGFAAPAKFSRYSRQNTRVSKNFPREGRPQNIGYARALSGENRAEGKVKRGKTAR